MTKSEIRQYGQQLGAKLVILLDAEVAYWKAPLRKYEHAIVLQAMRHLQESIDKAWKNELGKRFRIVKVR
jgi:hypothetical protein